MAKVKGGLLGSVSGKLGPVVVVQRGDTTYVRARPVYTENSWSERQLKNQQRFRAVNAFCTQNKLMVIQPIWNKLVAGKSGYHLFLKANMPAFGRDGGLEDLSLLHFSDGKLALPFHLQARRLDAMTIRVSWENDPLLPASRMRDELLFITAEDQQLTGL
ncbi:hypothetical protein [Mangrovibacterium marinum]|uniref:hypothetical protein n=1 Tax=Mangrovibacterium marinum TaxID=1639118 RepID=UPI002A18BBEA|nr:hypothetical protein [Mangrovibacterium marinum]